MAPCQKPIAGLYSASQSPATVADSTTDDNRFCPQPACVAGQFCAWRGAAPCNPIAAFPEYSECFFWAAACVPCPEGTYKSAAGTYALRATAGDPSTDYTCVNCPTGKTTVAVGSTAETDCIDPTAPTAANTTALPAALAAQATSTSAVSKFSCLCQKRHHIIKFV